MHVHPSTEGFEARREKVCWGSGPRLLAELSPARIIRGHKLSRGQRHVLAEALTMRANTQASVIVYSDCISAECYQTKTQTNHQQPITTSGEKNTSS